MGSGDHDAKRKDALLLSSFPTILIYAIANYVNNGMNISLSLILLKSFLKYAYYQYYYNVSTTYLSVGKFRGWLIDSYFMMKVAILYSSKINA